VDLVEPMGPETLFYLKTGAHSFIVRSQGQAFEAPVDKIELVAHMEKAHFFEAIDPNRFRKDSGSIDVEKWQAACQRIV